MDPTLCVPREGKNGGGEVERRVGLEVFGGVRLKTSRRRPDVESRDRRNRNYSWPVENFRTVEVHVGRDVGLGLENQIWSVYGGTLHYRRNSLEGTQVLGVPLQV